MIEGLLNQPTLAEEVKTEDAVFIGMSLEICRGHGNHSE